MTVVILHWTARDRRAGEDAQGLNREGRRIAFMLTKSGDTARRRPSVYGGFPSASNATHGGDASLVSAARNISPHINDAVPMSKMSGPILREKDRAGQRPSA